MPTVLREGPYRLYFYSSNGKEPAHVHVDREQCSLKVWLDKVEVAHNIRFAPHEVREILKRVRQRQPELLKAWNEYFSADRR
jgi:hypothetical protein